MVGVALMSSIEKQFTITEVAGMLKVNERTVRRWIKAGKIDAVPIPGRGRTGTEWRIPKGSIETMGFKFEEDKEK